MKEKNKKVYNSILLILISVLVWLYLAKYVGWLMDILGGYEHEGESPDLHAIIIVFLNVLPAFVVQLLNLRYLKKCYETEGIFLENLIGIFVIVTFWYTIIMLPFSIWGWYFSVIFAFVGVPVISLLSILFLIGYLIFRLIKLLKNKNK